MTAEIMGVSVERFRDPIHQALGAYEDRAGGNIKFDTISASNLTLTLDKPNSARSASKTLFKGNEVGTLYVIAFKPGDGTGDEKTHQLANLDIAPPYPRLARVVPRSKATIHCEGHLTLVTHGIEDVHAEPILFDGSLDLLGLRGNKVLKIGLLGQTDGKTNLEPTVTYTTGYDKKGQRFADPHSVFATLPDRIQVCAFWAISEAINQQYANILTSFSPQFPIQKE